MVISALSDMGATLKLALDTRYLLHVNIIVALFQGEEGTKMGTTQSVGRSVGHQGSRGRA